MLAYVCFVFVSISIVCFDQFWFMIRMHFNFQVGGLFHSETWQAGEASIARMDKMRNATGPIPTAVLRRELQVGAL